MKTVLFRRRRLGRTSTRGIRDKSQNDIEVIRNDLAPVPEDVDLVIRWGCTGNTGVRNTVNTAKAIHQVNDKLGFRKLLQEKAPNIVPKTWFSVIGWIEAGYPKAIVRPDRHAQGKNLELIEGEEGLITLRNFINKHPRYYISEFIDKVAEYRVFVIQGRVACVAEKTPGNPDQVAWNVAQGGRFDNVRWGDWNLKAVRIAIEGYNFSDLDFGGVDIMTDAQNNAYVIEINSAPSLTSDYRQQCFAKCFDYIIENGKERIPLVNKLGDWKKFAHPALNKRVLVP